MRQVGRLLKENCKYALNLARWICPHATGFIWSGKIRKKLFLRIVRKSQEILLNLKKVRDFYHHANEFFGTEFNSTHCTVCNIFYFS